MQVGDEPRVREQRRLHHRVVGHPGDGRLAAVDETLTIAPPALACAGSAARVARTAVIRLSSNDALPVVVGQLGELADLGAADVVDEAVDAAETLERSRDQPLGLAGSARSATTCSSPSPRRAVPS